jgi:hypothetical protein
VALHIKIGKPEVSMRKDGLVRLQFPLEDATSDKHLNYAEDDWIRFFREALTASEVRPAAQVGNTSVDAIVPKDQIEACVTGLRSAAEIANQRFEAEVAPARQAEAQKAARAVEERRKEKERVNSVINALFDDDASSK